MSTDIITMFLTKSPIKKRKSDRFLGKKIAIFEDQSALFHSIIVSALFIFLLIVLYLKLRVLYVFLLMISRLRYSHDQFSISKAFI